MTAPYKEIIGSEISGRFNNETTKSQLTFSNFGTDYLSKNAHQCFSNHEGPEKMLKYETVMVLAGLELIFCMVAGM